MKTIKFDITLALRVFFFMQMFFLLETTFELIDLTKYTFLYKTVTIKGGDIFKKNTRFMHAI